MVFPLPSDWQSKPLLAGAIQGRIESPALPLSGSSAFDVRVVIRSVAPEPTMLVGLDYIGLVLVGRSADEQEETWFRFQEADEERGHVILEPGEELSWTVPFLARPRTDIVNVVQLISEHGVEATSRMRPPRTSIPAPWKRAISTGNIRLFIGMERPGGVVEELTMIESVNRVIL